MARRVISCAFGLGLLACSGADDSGAGAPAPDETPFQAGFALRDVSPTEAELATGEVYMGAYGILTQRGAATSVHDSIYARTLVVGHGEEFEQDGGRPLRFLRRHAAGRRRRHRRTRDALDLRQAPLGPAGDLEKQAIGKAQLGPPPVVFQSG